MPFVSRRREAAEEIRDELGPVAERMAESASKEIVDLMRRSDPTGEDYGLPDGGTYQASAPGEPPAVRTGEYVDSYGWTSWHLRASRAVAAVSSDRLLADNSPLWPHLEYGTSTQAPRPHVRPSAQAVAARFRRVAERESSVGAGLDALPAAA